MAKHIRITRKHAATPQHSARRILIGLLIALAVVAAVAVVTACGATPAAEVGTSSTVVSQPAAPVATTEPPASVTAGPAPAVPAPTVTAGGKAADLPSFPAQSYSGTGDTVVTLEARPDGPAAVTLSTEGSGAVVAWAIDENGNKSDMVAMSFGAYSGTALLDATGFGQPTASIELTAPGAWSLTVAPVASAAPWDGRSLITGQGDAVLYVAAPQPSGTLTAAYDGTGAFIVSSFDSGMFGYDTVVMAFGAYSGSKVLDAGVYMVTVKAGADGSWSLSAS